MVFSPHSSIVNYPESQPLDTSAISQEQFRELLIAALEDSPRARRIVRQAFLPSSPIQGGNPTQDYIPYFTGSGTVQGLGDSVIYQDTTNSRIGIGTSSPAGKLDVRVNDASNVGLSIENDDSNTVPTQIRISGSSNSNQQLLIGYNTTNNYASIQSVLQGTAYKPLALQPNGSGVVIGGTTTKQSSGGPELLSFQHSDPDHVAFAGFVGTESNFRFGASVKGFMEWGPGSADQDVAFFRNWAGGLAVQSFNNTTSDHAFAVQKPTSDGSVGTDLFRVDTAANLAVILGKLGVNLSSPNFVLHTSGDAVALGAPNAAPTDANLNASIISFWLDQTNNNLKVRVKYSNGTLKTATIALS